MIHTEKHEPSIRIETQNNGNRNRTHLKTTEYTLIQEDKKCRTNKGNHDWKEHRITISQEPRLENF